MIERNGKTYYPTIGLEIHAELATDSKMFCMCKNDSNEEQPNKNICAVCMAHPGTLPVPNHTAIESVIRVGLAISGTIANFSEFDRKNYFYPDIPKGYQISQYKYPIVSGGELAGVKITRIHLEEDTGGSKHDQGDFSLVDFNRAGVPLMELVTEPVIHDADTAMNFAKEFQLLLRTLGVAHANMEKGEMRVELNLSISDKPDVLGTKVEIKNLNSFSVVGRAAAYEIDRMIVLYETGKQDEIVQETRGWDENRGTTYSQRRKENSNDYRYFPDPDIAKMYLHDMFGLDTLRAELPELPWQKRARYAEHYGIKSEDIESYVTDKQLGEFFEQVASELLPQNEKIKIASNFITNDIIGLQKETTNHVTEIISPQTVSDLASAVVDGEMTIRTAKDLLIKVIKGFDAGKSIMQYARENGLIQKNDPEALRAMVQSAIDNNPSVVAEYKSGKEQLLMFFVGQVMKESKGSANPGMVQELLKELLK